MRECDYRYVLNELDTPRLRRPLAAISAEIAATAKTMINGEECRLTEQTIAEYKRYRNSPVSACVRLSETTGISYYILADATIIPLAAKRRPDSYVMQDIYFRSLFEPPVFEAVVYAKQVCPAFFDGVSPYRSEQGLLPLGSFLFSTTMVQAYRSHNTYYLVDELPSGNFMLEQFVRTDNVICMKARVMSREEIPKAILTDIVTQNGFGERYPIDKAYQLAGNMVGLQSAVSTVLASIKDAEKDKIRFAEKLK